MFCGLTSRCTISMGRPRSSFLRWANSRAEHTWADDEARTGRAAAQPLLLGRGAGSCAGRGRARTPSRCSSSSRSCPGRRSGRCSDGLRPATILASSMNMSTNSLLSERWGRMRLTATTFSNPSTPVRLALNTSAMPPTAIFCMQPVGPVAARPTFDQAPASTSLRWRSAPVSASSTTVARSRLGLRFRGLWGDAACEPRPRRISGCAGTRFGARRFMRSLSASSVLVGARGGCGRTGRVGASQRAVQQPLGVRRLRARPPGSAWVARPRRQRHELRSAASGSGGAVPPTAPARDRRDDGHGWQGLLGFRPGERVEQRVEVLAAAPRPAAGLSARRLPGSPTWTLMGRSARREWREEPSTSGGRRCSSPRSSSTSPKMSSDVSSGGLSRSGARFAGEGAGPALSSSRRAILVPRFGSMAQAAFRSPAVSHRRG